MCMYVYRQTTIHTSASNLQAHGTSFPLMTGIIARLTILATYIRPVGEIVRRVISTVVVPKPHGSSSIAQYLASYIPSKDPFKGKIGVS